MGLRTLQRNMRKNGLCGAPGRESKLYLPNFKLQLSINA